MLETNLKYSDHGFPIELEKKKKKQWDISAGVSWQGSFSLSQEHMQAICTTNVGFRPCSLHTSGFSKPGGLHLLVLESKANKLINTIFTRGGQGKHALKCYTIT